MRRYDDRLRLGLCPQCGSKRDDWHIRCSKCNEYFRIYAREYRKRDNNNTVNARNYRTRNRRQRLCPTCGREIDDKKYKRCSKCRALTRSYYRKNLIKASKQKAQLLH